MSDDTSKRGPQDAGRVNVHEEHEVRYWTQKFGCSKAQLEQAVKAVGQMVKNVELELKK